MMNALVECGPQLIASLIALFYTLVLNFKHDLQLDK